MLSIDLQLTVVFPGSAEDLVHRVPEGMVLEDKWFLMIAISFQVMRLQACFIKKL